MNTTALTILPRELSALPEQIVETVRPYVGDGTVLEIGVDAEADDSGAYGEVVRGWRTPVRLLLITVPESAADRAYDDWVHWIAGGGLLAIPEGGRLYERAGGSGKFRELAAVDGLRIFQRIAACN